LAKLKDIIQRTQLGTTERGETACGPNISLIKMGNLGWGCFDLADVEKVCRDKINTEIDILRDGEILFNTRNAANLVGKSAVWRDIGSEAVADNNLNRFTLLSDSDPDFVVAYLNDGKGKKSVQSLAVGSTSVAAIYWRDVALLEIPSPPVEEQHEIAAILRTWDEAIDKSSSLLSAKRTHFAAVRRESIEASCKFTRTPVPLGRISARVRRKNNGQEHPVMTISAKSGFLLQSDKYSRDMAGSSLEHYTLLRQGEFAYNKGNSLTSPQGCLFRLEQDSALVPHVYFCFSMAETAFSDFYVHVFESGHLNHQLFRVINSGVRNDGLLNLAPEDFFRCTVPSPPHDEQVRIARTLDALKSEIRLYERQLELLQKQKRGLMQKLLTGEWRVKC
jgi:type I restriction enzyme S subunit